MLHQSGQIKRPSNGSPLLWHSTSSQAVGPPPSLDRIIAWRVLPSGRPRARAWATFFTTLWSKQYSCCWKPNRYKTLDFYSREIFIQNCAMLFEIDFLSVIGFIEFIVEPSMGVCADMLEVVLAPILGNSAKDTNKNKDAIEEEPTGEWWWSPCNHKITQFTKMEFNCNFLFFRWWFWKTQIWSAALYYQKTLGWDSCGEQEDVEGTGSKRYCDLLFQNTKCIKNSFLINLIYFFCK